MQITSLEQLQAVKQTEIVELPSFEDGTPFVVEIKKPNMMQLITSGKIPNTLLKVAMDMFNGKVGEKLRLISENRQVICITHLPQIAAVSDFHYLIQKETDGNTVETGITALDDEASIRELARMLGGANVTGKILESAREMKELAKRER